MNEFDIQSLRKKIKREPIEVNITLFLKYFVSKCLIFTIIYTIFQENIDEYDHPTINVSRVVKPEMIEEDEYEHDSVYESHVPFGNNDISIKSECPDYEDEFDEQYYEEEDTNVSYTFRRNETVSMDVVLADNNSVQCIQTDHNDDITIPTVIIIYSY